MAPQGRVLTLSRHLVGGSETTATAVKFTKIHPALGAEVEGFDLKEPLSVEQIKEINELWGQANGILIFKEQTAQLMRPSSGHLRLNLAMY